MPGVVAHSLLLFSWMAAARGLTARHAAASARRRGERLVASVDVRGDASSPWRAQARRGRGTRTRARERRRAARAGRPAWWPGAVPLRRRPAMLPAIDGGAHGGRGEPPGA